MPNHYGDEATFENGKTLKYAGQKNGWISKEEYQTKLDAGELARGHEWAEIKKESLVNHAKDAWNGLPEDFHTAFKYGTGKLKEAYNNIPDNVKAGAATTWEWGFADTYEKGMQVLDFPATAATYISKKVDPSGRGIDKDIFTLGEAALTMGGSSTIKNGKSLLKNGSKFFDDVDILLKTANKKQLAGVNGATNGFHNPMKITVHDSENLIGKGAIRNKENKAYFEKIEKYKKKGVEKKIVDNARVTPPKTIDNTPEVFKDQTFVVPDPTVKQHHIFPKAEEGAFLEIMEEIGDKEDVLNLLAVSNNLDAGGGGRMSGIINMFDKTHTHGGKVGEMLHPLRKETPGIMGLSSMQPSPTELKAMLREASGGDPTKLTQIFKRYIRENVIPFKQKAIELQAPYNKDLILPKGLKKSRQLKDSNFVYNLVYDPRVQHWISQFIN